MLKSVANMVATDLAILERTPSPQSFRPFAIPKNRSAGNLLSFDVQARSRQDAISRRNTALAEADGADARHGIGYNQTWTSRWEVVANIGG